MTPIDPASWMPRVRLSLSQVCAVADVSKMQLDYWTVKGRIPTIGHKQRQYEYRSILFVMLIKQAREAGLQLDAAIEAAREYLDRHHPEGTTTTSTA